jgi:hypothetical protein
MNLNNLDLVYSAAHKDEKLQYDYTCMESLDFLHQDSRWQQGTSSKQP